MSGPTPWRWYAGLYPDDVFDLSGPCLTREGAINEAHGTCWEDGDTFYVIEARSDGDPADEDGLYWFVETRNLECVEFKE